MDNKKPVILIVDDSPFNLQILREVTEDSGYEAVTVVNGRKALEFVKKQKPDLILLDIVMPQMDGYEVCKLLKSSEETKDIPIIFLTAKTEPEDIVKGFRFGAVDFVSKPFKAIELNARVKTHLELKRVRDELQEKNKQLQEAMNELERVATRDPLTNLFNRRYMMERMEQEVFRTKRTNRIFSLVLTDIDFFKKVNDTYGHDCGDFILKSLSKLMMETLRHQDVLVRWGGEEFLILLPETGTEGATVVSEKIRKKVEDSSFIYNDKEIKITMTFGVAEYSTTERIDDTIIRADKRLYEGKNSGRNKVVASKKLIF